MIVIKLKSLIAKKEILEKKQITIREIAEKTGISTGTISRIANGYGFCNTTTANIDKLCQYFQCSIGDLLEFVEDKNS